MCVCGGGGGGGAQYCFMYTLIRQNLHSLYVRLECIGHFFSFNTKHILKQLLSLQVRSNMWKSSHIGCHVGYECWLHLCL